MLADFVVTEYMRVVVEQKVDLEVLMHDTEDMQVDVEQ
jgi:hypothetical protein